MTNETIKQTKHASPDTDIESPQKRANSKPKWLAILLFICSVLYLFPEIAFNAKLVEIAGGFDVTDEQLHKTELFGRTISGIGVTLLVADLLLKGWFTATKLRAVLSLLTLTAMVWPTVFLGQKALIDKWLIEPSAPQQRQEAFFSSVLRSSLAMNAVNIEGIPYSPEARTESSEMTFLALIGGLVYSNDAFLRHIDDKKTEILERYITNRANLNFEQHYGKYKDLRQEVQQAWKEYQTYVTRYNQAIASRHQRADKAWEEVESSILKGFGDYENAQKAYLARAEARAQKVAQPIFDLFEDQQRCLKRQGNSQQNCLNRVEERYERVLSKNAIPFKPMDYWLEIKHRRTKGETSWSETLGTLGLSAVLAGLEQAAGQGGEAQLDRIYTNRVSHYTPRILALWQDKFSKETGYPMGIESLSDFRHHPTTANKIRRDVRKKGIELNTNWQVAQISQFKSAVKKRVIAETDSKWRSEAQKRNYDLAPNLSWQKFQQIEDIQVKIRNSMGERYYIQPMMATWNNKQFYQKVIVPNVARERDYWLGYIEAARAQFADGGPYAEQGKSALRAIIVPPISMGLSLFLVILTVFKLPGKFISLLNYDKPQPAKSLKRTVSNMSISLALLLVIFIVPVNAFSSKYTQSDSTIGYFLDQISDSFSPSSAYVVRWVIHTQPLIHPIGAQIDQGMRISDGFSRSLEHLVANIDDSFSKYVMSLANKKKSTDTSQIDKANKSKEPVELPFIVNSDAETLPGYRIRVMNIKPRYQYGMLLPPGSYDIEVSADGYRSKRLWVEHSQRQLSHFIKLEKVSM